MADDSVEPQLAEAAATVWCGHATAYMMTTAGKPWRYLLVPVEFETREA